jgi:hypothetical protein
MREEQEWGAAQQEGPPFSAPPRRWLVKAVGLSGMAMACMQRQPHLELSGRSMRHGLSTHGMHGNPWHACRPCVQSAMAALPRKLLLLLRHGHQLAIADMTRASPNHFHNPHLLEGSPGP